MEFAQPLWFLLLPLPLLWAALAWKRGAQGEDGAWLLRHPHLSGGSSAPPSPVWPLALNTLAFLLLVLALAQPREIGRWIAPPPEGRDIALVIDTSLTMSIDDLGQMTYHLRRLRLHGLIQRIPNTHRYQCHRLRLARPFLLHPHLCSLDPPRSGIDCPTGSAAE